MAQFALLLSVALSHICIWSKFETIPFCYLESEPNATVVYFFSMFTVSLCLMICKTYIMAQYTSLLSKISPYVTLDQ